MTANFEMDGRKVSLLGYGAMRMPMNEGAGFPSGIDEPLVHRQVKLMLDRGMTYFDTSPAYCRGHSERILGEALHKSGYPREAYVLATKLSNFAPHQYPLAECRKLFENSLKYLRTDYIDNYLLHAIGNGSFETFSKRYLENGAAEWCLDLRAQKRIRHLGFSFHGDPKAFEWCLEQHDRYRWDFCLIQMNYVDWLHAQELNKNNLNAKYLYERLTALKIPVVIMEPLLGGRLARYNWSLAKELTPLDPEATLAQWALRFCGSFPNVMSVLSGMTRTEHIEENIETFSPLKPCTETELAALERAAVAMLKQNTIPCNSCNYCMPCPYGLDIPSILTFRNQILTEEVMPSAREILKRYRRLIPEELRRADHCTGCGRCNPHCPQTIDIPKEIAAIDEWMDTLKNEEAAR